MGGNISVIVVGRDRTLMTIECLKNIVRYLRMPHYNLIVGSDRSSPGHIKAVESYLKTLNVQYTILDCVSLGGMMNKCLDEAFTKSDYALCIENDMILHKDLTLSNYMDFMEHTNVGNIQFRYFSSETHKSGCGIIQYRDKTYVYTFPYSGITDGNPVSFGQNFLSKKFYDKVGPFLSNEFCTDKVERDFINRYSAQFSCSQTPMLNALDCETLHRDMNDERGYFYHIGILSQHANVKWNKNVIPSYYHYLSDSQLDEQFRKIFV